MHRKYYTIHIIPTHKTTFNNISNKKSAAAWKVVNYVSSRTNRAKLKAANEEKRIKLWYDHFNELLGK